MPGRAEGRDGPRRSRASASSAPAPWAAASRWPAPTPGSTSCCRTPTQDGLDRGMEAIRRNYAMSVKRGRFTDAGAAERLARIRPQLDLAGFETADVDHRGRVRGHGAEAAGLSRPRSRRAARAPSWPRTRRRSTSTTSPAATARPADVVGLHFFSPANVMRLLEIVRGRATAAATLATALALAKTPRQGRRRRRQRPGIRRQPDDVPVHVRVRSSSSRRARRREQVDGALTGFGMAMGIFAVDDMAGLDVAIRVRQALGHFSDPAVRRAARAADSWTPWAASGQKTGQGLVPLRRRPQAQRRIPTSRC